MLHHRSTCRFALITVALVVVVLAGPFVPGGQAQGAGSAAAAADLTRLLDAAKLDSIAAVDPADPSLWVAALYFKDSQLLVVSAQYSAPALLTEKMRVKDYRDIYLALFSSPVAGTKVFVMDSSADGLSDRPSNGEAPDMWEQKDTTTMFDGQWRKAKVSEEDYRKAFAKADEHYARLLKLLAAQARGGGGT